MKRLFILLLPLLFLSCEMDYMDNRRGHFTGQIIDQNGDAIQNAQVKLEVVTFGFKNSNYHLLESDYTDENGVFDLLSIEPKNKGLYLTISNIFNEYDFIRLVESGIEGGPYYNFGELSINKPGDLQIDFINESGGDATVYIEAVYFTYTPLAGLPLGWTLDSRMYDEMESEEVLDTTSISTETTGQYNIRTIQGSEVFLRYSIGETLHESENVQKINFSINEPEIQYEVIY